MITRKPVWVGLCAVCVAGVFPKNVPSQNVSQECSENDFFTKNVSHQNVVSKCFQNVALQNVVDHMVSPECPKSVCRMFSRQSQNVQRECAPRKFDGKVCYQQLCKVEGKTSISVQIVFENVVAVCDDLSSEWARTCIRALCKAPAGRGFRDHFVTDDFAEIHPSGFRDHFMTDCFSKIHPSGFVTGFVTDRFVLKIECKVSKRVHKCSEFAGLPWVMSPNTDSKVMETHPKLPEDVRRSERLSKLKSDTKSDAGSCYTAKSEAGEDDATYTVLKDGGEQVIVKENSGESDGNVTVVQMTDTQVTPEGVNVNTENDSQVIMRLRYQMEMVEEERSEDRERLALSLKNCDHLMKMNEELKQQFVEVREKVAEEFKGEDLDRQQEMEDAWASAETSELLVAKEQEEKARLVRELEELRIQYEENAESGVSVEAEKVKWDMKTLKDEARVAKNEVCELNKIIERQAKMHKKEIEETKHVVLEEMSEMHAGSDGSASKRDNDGMDMFKKQMMQMQECIQESSRLQQKLAETMIEREKSDREHRRVKEVGAESGQRSIVEKALMASIKGSSHTTLEKWPVEVLSEKVPVSMRLNKLDDWLIEVGSTIEAIFPGAELGREYFVKARKAAREAAEKYRVGSIGDRVGIMPETQYTEVQEVIEQRVKPMFVRAVPAEVRGQSASINEEDEEEVCSLSVAGIIFEAMKLVYNGGPEQRTMLWTELQSVVVPGTLGDLKVSIKQWTRNYLRCKKLKICMDAGILGGVVLKLCSRYEMLDHDFQKMKDDIVRLKNIKRMAGTDVETFEKFLEAITQLVDIAEPDKKVDAPVAKFADVRGPIMDEISEAVAHLGAIQTDFRPDYKPVVDASAQMARKEECVDFTNGRCKLGSTCTKFHKRPYPFKGCMECGGPNHRSDECKTVPEEKKWKNNPKNPMNSDDPKVREEARRKKEERIQKAKGAKGGGKGKGSAARLATSLATISTLISGGQGARIECLDSGASNNYVEMVKPEYRVEKGMMSVGAANGEVHRLPVFVNEEMEMQGDTNLTSMGRGVDVAGYTTYWAPNTKEVRMAKLPWGIHDVITKLMNDHGKDELTAEVKDYVPYLTTEVADRLREEMSKIIVGEKSVDAKNMMSLKITRLSDEILGFTDVGFEKLCSGNNALIRDLRRATEADENVRGHLGIVWKITGDMCAVWEASEEYLGNLGTSEILMCDPEWTIPDTEQEEKRVTFFVGGDEVREYEIQSEIDSDQDEVILVTCGTDSDSGGGDGKIAYIMKRKKKGVAEEQEESEEEKRDGKVKEETRKKRTDGPSAAEVRREGNVDHGLAHWPFDRNCEVCRKSKMTKGVSRRKKATIHKFREGGERGLYMDLMGPFPKSTTGDRMIAVITEPETGRIAARPMKHKDSIVAAVHATRLEWGYEDIPTVIHCDNETVFRSEAMDAYLERSKARTHCGIPHRHNTNAIAEAACRKVGEGLRAIMTDSATPLEWWPLAAETLGVHLDVASKLEPRINKCRRIPYGTLGHVKLSPEIKDVKTRLDASATPVVMLGYDLKTSGGYKVGFKGLSGKLRRTVVAEVDVQWDDSMAFSAELVNLEKIRKFALASKWERFDVDCLARGGDEID